MMDFTAREGYFSGEAENTVKLNPEEFRAALLFLF
jgi:hypothetical protein